MLVVALAALLAPLLLAEEGIVCPKGISSFAADPRAHREDQYWACPAAGARAVLSTCPEGQVYNSKWGRCRRGGPRLAKRADGSSAKTLELLEIENLRGPAQLGQLYDAKEDKFVPGTFGWGRADMTAKKVVQDQVYSNVDVYQDSSVDDRAYHLNVKASLKLGFLSGLITVEGAAEYLRNEKTSSNVARVTMSYHSTRASETMPISTPLRNAGRICAEAAKDNAEYTHVLTSRILGLRAFLVFDRETTSTETVEDISGKLAVEINSIPGFKLKGSAWIDIHGKEAETFDRLSVSYHGDAVISAPTSYASAITAFNEVQAKAQTAEVPVRYQLTPLSYLCDDSTAQMHELGNKLVVRATEVLVELAQTQLDTAALLESSVSNSVPKIKAVLNSFSTALTTYTNSKKLAIKNQLKELRAGTGTEATLVGILGEYETSPYSYNKAALFLEVRKREISTIELVTQATAGQDMFIVSDNSATDNEALLDHRFAAIYTLNVLPTSNAAQEYIDSGEVPDESHYWYNDLTKVGQVGAFLKDFVKYGLANAPVNSQDKSHCFIIRVNPVDTENPDDIVRIKYLLDGGTTENNFIPPPTPPTPVCSPKYTGFKISTSSTNNAFVKKHWMLASLVDEEGEETVAIRKGGLINVLTMTGLDPNTAYNISTKYKVFDEEDAGFSPASEVVLCATAPSTPVQSLAVSAATADSLTVTWAAPANVAPSVASSMEYVVQVLRSGAPEEEAVLIRTRGLTTTVRDLDPATLYHVSAHTESALSYSEPVQTSHTTAPSAIPFPEVVLVQESSVQLVEKLSLLTLPSEMEPWRLHVEVYQVDEDAGRRISGTGRNEVVELAGSRGDKIFTLGSLEGGKSYGITVQLQTRFNGVFQTSSTTDQLSITTPFGGTEVEKVEQQFDQIKQDTNTRADRIEGEVTAEAGKLASLRSDLDAYYREAAAAIGQVEDITASNFTAQEGILNGVVKESCVEYGVKYYSSLLATVQNVDSLQQCRSKCAEHGSCKGASWSLTRRTCELHSKRRGSYLQNVNGMISVNNVCYESMVSSSAKWEDCIKENTDFNGADISNSQSYGFDTIYDCTAWCLNTATCKSVTFSPSAKHCWLKNRDQGNSVNAHSAVSSLSLACLQA